MIKSIFVEDGNNSLVFDQGDMRQFNVLNNWTVKLNKITAYNTKAQSHNIFS